MENGHALENGHGATNGDTNTVHMDYSTHFPSLPISVPNGASSSKESAWNRPRPIQSKDYTLTFILPPTERSSKVKSFSDKQQSEEHKRCAGIATQTGCRIELSESKDGSLTVIIKGARSKVEEAKNQVVRGLQTQDKQSISIPKDHHRKLIGKEGQALKQLEADTNCTITIPKRDDRSDVIEIKGPAEGIRRAMQHIREVSHKEASQAVEHIVCPKYLYPFIRGPFNETYDKLVNDHNVKINIPPSHASNEVINISGPKEGVQISAAIIKKIVAEKEKTAKVISIQVVKAQHRFIIGQQRKGLHEILRDTGVSVEVPNEDENSDHITLRGDQSKLGDALALVYQRASSVITQTIECPVWLHKKLIGAKGSRLTELCPNRNKVQIDFDEGGHIFLEGSPEEVKIAFTALDAEASKLKKEMAIEKVKVHPDLHRHVIGRSGSNISKIKEDAGVEIVIPKENLNSDEITIEGPKDGVAKAVKEIKALVSKIENEKSKDIIVEQRLHKLLIGTKGSGISKIREKFPNVIVNFPDSNKKSDVITIRGDKKDVEAVAEIFKKDVKEINEKNYQETIKVFKDFHKHVIGKQGQNINKIRSDFNVKVDLPNQNNESDDKVVVTGKKEDVRKAIARINDLQNEHANMVTIDLEVPVKVQGRLLGGGRRLIQNIEEECGGVHIKFPAEKSESTKVTIRGPESDAKRAESLLSALVKDKEQNFVEDTVTAKPEFHKFLIGKGGSKINKIRESHDVRIMFPRESDTDKETIHLLGKKEDVEKVKKELEACIQQLNETVEEKVEIAQEYHKHFLDRKALVLREIQDQNGGVTISFPRQGAEDATTVTIKGSKQCVEAAKAKMEETVDELIHQTTIELEVDKSKYPAIIRSGKMKDIEKDYKVKIVIPGRNDDTNLVTIRGRDTMVEAARQTFMNIVPITESITVPVHIHRELIGTRTDKALNDLINEFNVNITVPLKEGQPVKEKFDKDGNKRRERERDPNQKPDEIRVSGPAEGVAKCLDAIRHLMEEHEAKKFQLPITIPADYHSKIIGPNGTTIRGYRSRHHVEIDIPKDRSEEIVITGKEENAQACADEINKLVEDIRALYTQEISLDSNYHRVMTGFEGKKLKETENKYGVIILFPRRPDEDDLVWVCGSDEEKLFDCIDYLKDDEENWLDRNSHRPSKIHHKGAPAHQAAGNARGGQANVVINNAPWQMNAADFPDMGSGNQSAPQTVGGAWGGPRRW